jgi:hypothetical protein
VQAFIALRQELKIPSRRSGLRHGFVTYHFALHQNENLTAAQAGNSPNPHVSRRFVFFARHSAAIPRKRRNYLRRQ